MTHDIEKRLLSIRSASAVEACAHEVHLEVWKNRHELFGGNPPRQPLGLVEPGIALYMKGFEVITDPALGEMWEEGCRIQVAGTVDQNARVVRVAQNLDDQQRRYTTGHELGHVIRHPGMSLHRDRAISGHLPRRDEKEREADWFSSCFLMPARHVINEFYCRFGLPVLRMSEDVVFGMSLGSVENVRRKIKCQRDVSMAAATAVTFMGRQFRPLCQAFGVSPIAMAIRLEEVGLVDRTSARWAR